MAIEVTLPRQGWSMEEAVFVEWLKKDGDEVRAGDPVFAVETEKAVQEIESLDAGILRLASNAPKAGDTVRLADVLGYLVAPGEAAPTGAPRLECGDSTPHSSPPRQAAADESAVKPAHSKANVSDEPVVQRPVSPRAARRALQAGVDLRAVQGTGRGGRIRESDVVAAMQGQSTVGALVSAPVVPALPPLPGRDEKITPLRRTIAERMHRSKTLTAPVTLTTRADAGGLVRLRERLKAEAGGKAVPSYGDIIMRAVAQALVEHPALNAQWQEDKIRYPDSVNIGFAVDTDAGLVVPVVRDAPKRSLQELADLTRDLADRAKARRLSAEEMGGGTFTLTNLGMSGIDAFTPVINWPECAVLGLGRITQEPVVKGNTVGVGDRLWLSLTFDHRIVDGAPAARFLEAVRGRIETVFEDNKRNKQ
jgi:pyruvate dehydrogenase E2 component (dihydrolipoamide acetyltransferase)